LKNFLIILFVLVRFNGFCQTLSQNDFVQIPTPADRSKEWYAFNLSVRTRVEVSLAGIQLQLAKGNRRDVYQTYKLPHGDLVALDQGEFGGGLYYKPDDAADTVFNVNGKPTIANKEISKIIGLFSPRSASPKGKFLLIKYGNANGIFVYKGELYFTEGLSHMGTNQGAMYKVEIHDESVNAVKVIDFDEAIRSTTVYKGVIYVATFSKFYVVRDFKKELILDSLFWYGFNPSSIAVIDDHNIYVGMYGFYAKIDAIKKEMLLYKYKE